MSYFASFEYLHVCFWSNAIMFLLANDLLFLYYLAILRRLSWPSLVYLCTKLTKNPIYSFIMYLEKQFLLILIRIFSLVLNKNNGLALRVRSVLDVLSWARVSGRSAPNYFPVCTASPVYAAVWSHVCNLAGRVYPYPSLPRLAPLVAIVL